MRPLSIKTGEAFHRLMVVEELPPFKQPSGQTKRQFLFKCLCGNSVTALLDNVRKGRTKSCGCLNQEVRIKHGEADNPFTKIWYAIHERCNHRKNYKDRGITVCPEWHGLEGLKAFLKWAAEQGTYEKGLEIDRRDNDQGYSPNNCRFVTKSVNARNKRNALLVEHPVTGNKISLITLWEQEGNSKLNWETVRARILYHNWSVQDAISKPSRIHKK